MRTVPQKYSVACTMSGNRAKRREEQIWAGKPSKKSEQMGILGSAMRGSAARAVARLRSWAEPLRGHVELSQTGRAVERLGPRPHQLGGGHAPFQAASASHR